MLLKVLKRLLKIVAFVFIGLPLGLLVLAGVVYAAYGSWAKGGVDEVHVAYLRQHAEFVVRPDEFRFTVFDSAFYRNKLFLLGESHGSAALQSLDFALLHHLNKRAGVRHYVAEIDAAQAHYFNEYLRTGDEANLRAVFAFWAGTAQWGNQDFYQKIQRIRELNRTLPDDRQIRFVGIDRVQDLTLAGRRLNELLGSTTGAPALDSLRQQLSDTTGTPDRGMVASLARRAAATLPTLPDSVAAPVGTLLRNLGYLARPLVARDSAMVLNLGAEYAAGRLQPADKLYGLWGMTHVLQDEFNHGRSLAGQVRRSTLPCREGVTSVVAFLLDSEMLLPTAAVPAPMRPPGGASTIAVGISQNGPLVFAAGVGDLAEATRPHPATLFRLDAPGSPYRSSQRLAAARAPIFNQTMLPTRDGAVTTDFFQYAVLVRNSPAVQPLAPAATRR